MVFEKKKDYFNNNNSDNHVSDSTYLYPSGIVISKAPHKVDTILGSCVAVCLWDPVLRVGGINHYMLPFWNGKGLASPKYGNIAIEMLIKKMLAIGCKKKDLKAKIFGGADVMQTYITGFHIGERNIEIAGKMLKEAAIRIVSSSIGGLLGRKIIFYTETGEVLQRFIRKNVEIKKDVALHEIRT